MERKRWQQTDKLVAGFAVGVVAAAGLAAALMAARPDGSDSVAAGGTQADASRSQKTVVTAPPLKATAKTAAQDARNAGARTAANAMGSAPVCPNCGVVQMVVAVYGYGQPRPDGYQMHIRMDDGGTRTVQQRGALAAGSRVVVEGDAVRALAERPGPG